MTLTITTAAGQVTTSTVADMRSATRRLDSYAKGRGWYWGKRRIDANNWEGNFIADSKGIDLTTVATWTLIK